jgi:hypothetical protein
MSKLTVRVRTKKDLTQLLKQGGSGWWTIASHRDANLAQIEVYNWDGSLVIKAEYDSQISKRNENNKLYLGFKNAKIETVNPPLKWQGRNPVNYVEDNPSDSKTLQVEIDHRLIDKNLEELIAGVVEKKIKEMIPQKPEKQEPTRRELLEDLLSKNYGEPIELLDYQISNNLVSGWFLEKRREWYFDFELDLRRKDLGYKPNDFIRNMSDDVLYKIYPRLRQREKNLIFNLIRLTFKYSGEVLLLSEDEFPEDINEYGFIPQSPCFPVIIYHNPKFKMVGGFYLFNNSKKSLSEQIISDDNDESVRVFEDWEKALKYLVQRMDYYRAES